MVYYIKATLVIKLPFWEDNVPS